MPSSSFGCFSAPLHMAHLSVKVFDVFFAGLSSHSPPPPPAGLVKQCSAPALSSNSGVPTQKPLPALQSFPEDDENSEKPAGETELKKDLRNRLFTGHGHGVVSHTLQRTPYMAYVMEL